MLLSWEHCSASCMQLNLLNPSRPSNASVSTVAAGAAPPPARGVIILYPAAPPPPPPAGHPQVFCLAFPHTPICGRVLTDIKLKNCLGHGYTDVIPVVTEWPYGITFLLLQPSWPPGSQLFEFFPPGCLFFLLPPLQFWPSYFLDMRRGKLFPTIVKWSFQASLPRLANYCVSKLEVSSQVPERFIFQH